MPVNNLLQISSVLYVVSSVLVLISALMFWHLKKLHTAFILFLCGVVSGVLAYLVYARKSDRLAIGLNICLIILWCLAWFTRK